MTINTVKFIRLRQVAERLGVSTSTVWRLTKRGELSRPVKLGPLTTAWIESDVQAYMDKVIRQRDEA